MKDEENSQHWPEALARVSPTSLTLRASDGLSFLIHPSSFILHPSSFRERLACWSTTATKTMARLSAQPIGVELPPAIRADLLDPANWHEGLATFARATNLAAACPSRERRYASVSPVPGVHLCQLLACSLQPA